MNEGEVQEPGRAGAGALAVTSAVDARGGGNDPAEEVMDEEEGTSEAVEETGGREAACSTAAGVRRI